MHRWFALLALVCVGLVPLANAQSPYPAKPIRLVVPFPAGGTTDILAREVAQKLTEAWGQSVVVDNRPGAGGNIGSELVAKSAPDGYTLLMGTVGTHAINPSLYAKMPYDHVKDFVPVILVAGVPNVLVVNPHSRSTRSPNSSLMARQIRASSISRRPAAARRSIFRASSSRR
jgi:tripartite-type tricarboxylate transporter receptor subunit TctC